MGGSAGLQPPPVPAELLSREGPSSPEQRTEDLRFDFQSLHLPTCTALEAPGLLGNGSGRSVQAAGDASQPWTGRSELLAGTSHRNPSRGKENAPSNAEASALSHLISSFAAFRGRFNLLGSGKQLTLQRAGCIPMTRGSPRASGLILWQLPGMPAGKPVPVEAGPCGTGTRMGPGALAGPCRSDPAGP